jgi:hypothetical protein
MSSEEEYASDDASRLTQEVFGGKLTIQEALERLRTRLLDLSIRNRLLNYRHPKGRSIQFVDRPDLDLLFDRLKEEGKAVSVLPVPDPPTEEYEQGKKPEARRYAAQLGMDTAVEFFPGAVQSTRNASLRALMYPADLERFLRRLSGEAHTVIEETGTNMLHLMFGFLEFYESDDSEKPLLAPLIAMPVSLERGRLDQQSRAYVYDITHSGEDVVENFTLREKLREMRLHLPELDEDDVPQAYFAKLGQAVSKRRKWKIRRQLSLGFLSFGKLAIWSDLDPAKAPSLLSTPLLKNLFEGGNGDSEERFHAEDYNIDKHEHGELPLIFDADSSQHSAIIDVLSGRNVVVNGPPGTGKSQTITNIIAAAMAAGKKVLFVSEKLAALEVVKRRLEQAGLGQFCLEIHSNKTQKRQLLEGLADRIKSRFSATTAYKSQLQVLRERRRSLNTYAEILGSKAGNRLDLTVHEVFWAAERHRITLGEAAEALRDVLSPGCVEWTAEDADRRRRVLRSVADAAADIGCPVRRTAWLGFFPSLMVAGDESPVARAVSEALAVAEKLELVGSRLSGICGPSDWTINQILRIQDALQRLPQSISASDPSALPVIFPPGRAVDSVERAFSRFFEDLSEVRADMQIVRSHLVTESIESFTEFQAVEAAAGVHLRDSVDQLSPSDLGAIAATVLRRCSELEVALSRTAGSRPPSDPESVARDIESAIRQNVDVAHPAIGAGALARCASECLAICTSLRMTLNDVRSQLGAAQISFTGATSEVRELLEGRGYGELSGQRQSEDTLTALHQLVEKGFGDWTGERFLSTARELQRDLAAATSAANTVGQVTARLGLPFHGGPSDIDAVLALVEVAEAAPIDLLAYRTKGFDDAAFPEHAVRAEDAQRLALRLREKVDERFHSDEIPPLPELQSAARAVRRGDGVWNWVNREWRKARRSYLGFVRTRSGATATAMQEGFALAVRWRQAELAVSEDDSCRQLLGPLFQGMATDFNKVRRLHAWYRGSSAAQAEHLPLADLELSSLPESQLRLLVAQGARVRSCATALKGLWEQASGLPALTENAVAATTIGELSPQLEKTSQRMFDAAKLLDTLGSPGATTGRLQFLTRLRQQHAQNPVPLRTLLEAPERLSLAAAALGLDISEVASNLDHALARASEVATAAGRLADRICQHLGPELTAPEATTILKAAVALRTASAPYLRDDPSILHDSWVSLLKAHSGPATVAQQYANVLARHAKPGQSCAGVAAAMRAAGRVATKLSAISCDVEFNSVFGPLLLGLDTDDALLASCLQWAKLLDGMADSLPESVRARLLQEDGQAVLDECRAAVAAAGNSYESYRAKLAELVRHGSLDWTIWGSHATASAAVTHLNAALGSLDQVVPWSRYLAAKDEAHELELGLLIQKLEAEEIAVGDLVVGFDFAFFRMLSKRIVSGNRFLARFSGRSHDQLRQEFAQLDREIIRLNGAEHAARINALKRTTTGVSSGRAGDLTEMSLITKEIAKQRRHIPIRQLLRRAGRSVLELKPCFMMGPLSVAQYLEKGVLTFDIVVMDEASQLRPEDALGAVARGKQLVVVGDPKQLPPTTFFDRLMDGDDEETDDAPALTDGVESILGVCEQLYRPVRTLRWHYRSQHESLIAFSNRQFYGGQLVVFPSPYDRNGTLGVAYRYVENGVYQDRRNLPEAERVVEAVVKHMLSHPEESLGVVTLNQTQRDLIEDLFEKKARSVSGVADYLDRHQKGGWRFFIKNLENVQGDERDVILVSTTFGRPPNVTSVRQYFGPINRPDGWRRLNVLFTRSRRRLELFSSMRPEDVIVDDKASKGRRALRDYLTYASTGMLPGPLPESGKREPDSDFEIAVAEALQAHGYDTECQLGVAGYFIDIGVRHPECRGEFLAAVECDGATYHSSLSARDRDRIRQEILESLGWRGRIIRVWSTDWFSDPRGETARLLRFLDDQRAAASARGAPYADADLDGDQSPSAPDWADGDDTPASAVIARNGGDVTGRLEASGASEVFVEVGDRVTYVMVEAASEAHTVQIVDIPSNVRLGLLNEATPVAQALLGLSEGEEGTIEVRGHPGRRIRVVKIAREDLSLVPAPLTR